MVIEPSKRGQPCDTAVLCSSGLDSAVLVAHETRRGLVQPIYVSVGFAWEPAERSVLTQLLETPTFKGKVNSLINLENTVHDIYPVSHWAIQSTPPAYDTPDSWVYLPGRNIMLLAKTAVFCAQQDINRIAIGPLAGNPFPDATPAFFDSISQALSLGLAHDIEVVAPFATIRKSEVIKLGHSLSVPFEFTLSCMNPSVLNHCGRCSKCRERLQAFAESGISDPAKYAVLLSDFNLKDPSKNIEIDNK